MGWMFGWNTRKELVDHLLNDNGLTTIKHCFKGNNLWCVHETTTTKAGYGGNVRWIALYLLRGRDKCDKRTGKYDLHGWGYKDMDESSGPHYYNCPLGYIEMVEAYEKLRDHAPLGYAAEWRVKVRAHHQRATQKLALGQMIKLYGNEYQVTADLGRRGYMISNQCYDYRVPKRLLKDVVRA
jgi:hypothetical protein